MTQKKENMGFRVSQTKGSNKTSTNSKYETCLCLSFPISESGIMKLLGWPNALFLLNISVIIS